jgi:hypothetical protein
MLTPKNQDQSVNYDLKNDFTLRIMAWILAIGISAILFVSIYTAFKDEPGKGLFPVLGLSLGIAFAATVTGGFLGFLFGIPKSLQKNQASSLPPNGAAGTSSNQTTTTRNYSSNTNLEEISDWLTKIIVGVSLIQLTKLVDFYTKSCRSLAKSFKGYLTAEFGFTYSGSLIIFFSVCGFLIVYLWARLYFLKQLNDIERSLEYVLNKVSKALTSQDVKFEKEKLERKIEDFNKERNKVTVRESLEDVRTVLERAKPNPVTFLNDCQKKRWGGESKQGAYVLSATVTQDGSDPDLYHVVATVITNDVTNSPLNDKVYFNLHDSYFPNSIIIADVLGNSMATCTFDSYEAFTIGVVANDGVVKLELDLNTDPDVPIEYKYPDTLETIDEIKRKLADLESQEG